MKALRVIIVLGCIAGVLASVHEQPSYIGSNLALALASSFFSSLIIGYAWGERAGRSSFYPRRIKRGTRKNTAMIVGVGRTGKSCLIEIMTAKLGKKKPILTNEFSIRSCLWTDDNKIPIYFHFTDYRGQDFSQLVSNFLKQQTVPYSLLRYGDINSLVIVVDIFGYNENEYDRTIHEKVDIKRIEAQIEEWNSTALDAVFGMVSRPALKYVCLFVNKVDKITGGNELIVRRHIKSCFKPLIDEIRRRTEGLEFDVMVGSALTGDAVLGRNGNLLDTEKTLLNQLWRFSVPLKGGDRV